MERQFVRGVVIVNHSFIVLDNKRGLSLSRAVRGCLLHVSTHKYLVAL